MTNVVYITADAVSSDPIALLVFCQGVLIGLGCLACGLLARGAR